MVEHRVHELERTVTSLQVANGRLEVMVETLSRQLVDNTRALERLTRTMRHGEKTIAIVGGAGMVAGAIGHFLVEYFARK